MRNKIREGKWLPQGHTVGSHRGQKAGLSRCSFHEKLLQGVYPSSFETVSSWGQGQNQMSVSTQQANDGYVSHGPLLPMLGSVPRSPCHQGCGGEGAAPCPYRIASNGNLYCPPKASSSEFQKHKVSSFPDPLTALLPRKESVVLFACFLPGRSSAIIWRKTIISYTRDSCIYFLLQPIWLI